MIGLWILTDPGMAALALETMPVTVIGHVVILGLAVPAALALFGAGAIVARLAGFAALWGALAFRWALFNGAQIQSKVETANYLPAVLSD